MTVFIKYFPTIQVLIWWCAFIKWPACIPVVHPLSANGLGSTSSCPVLDLWICPALSYCSRTIHPVLSSNIPRYALYPSTLPQLPCDPSSLLYHWSLTGPCPGLLQNEPSGNGPMKCFNMAHVLWIWHLPSIPLVHAGPHRKSLKWSIFTIFVA